LGEGCGPDRKRSLRKRWALGRKHSSRIRWVHGNDGAWGEEMFKKKWLRERMCPHGLIMVEKNASLGRL
jgi:hypothetical protein